MARAVKELGELGELTKIGQGGQGVVYRAPKLKTKFASSMVYKEYKAQARAGIDFSALAAMPDLVEKSLIYADGERLISLAAWPCEIVENNGIPAGFVMPEIPDEFFISLTTLKGVSRNLAEFQHLLNAEPVLHARGIDIDDVRRYVLLREVASVLTFLHSNGVCVGDISPKNLLFSLTPREAVYFIDCDAMRINGVSALPQVETPGWEVPPGEELATVYSDTYKLGLLALRLLAGEQDVRTTQHIPSTAPNLLRGLITDTLERAPQKRPLPESWTYVLGHAIEEAQHRKKTAPTPPPVKAAAPAPPPPPPVAPQQWSAPPRPPTSPQLSPTAKGWLIVAGLAVAAVALLVLVNLIVSHAGSGSIASSSSSTYPTTYGGYGGSTSYAPTVTATTPTLSFAAPADILQGADQGGDTRCNGGYYLGAYLSNNLWVAPATPSGGHYTSCGFAIAVGQTYAPGNHDPKFLTTVAVPSPTVRCDDIEISNPNVQCAGHNFVMQCQMAPTEQWITCRGGNNATVYIY
jgi:serine/threonine protein kinase